MMPTQETNHVGLGLKLLVEQFKATTQLPAYLSVYLRQFQELENVVWDVINKRMLDVATGDQLDMLGDLVGEARKGRNDTDYRAAVRLRIRVNRSQGLAEDVIDVSDLASGDTANYYEHFPAAFVVEIWNATSPIEVAKMLFSTKAAGTNGVLVYTNWATTTDIFTFDNSASPIAGNVFSNALAAPTERFPAAVQISASISQTISNAPAPTVTQISPPVSFKLAAGTAVTITGTGFNTFGTTNVTVGGVACTSVVVVNSTTITAVLGTQFTEGQKDVVVTNPDNQDSAPLVNGYLALQAYIWLSARNASTDYVLNGSSRIGTWNDKSGNGRNFSNGAATGPAINATAINGFPAVFCGNANEFCDLASFSGPSGGEIFVVEKLGATAQHGLWIFGTGTQNWNPFSDNIVYECFGSNTRKTCGTRPATMTSSHLYNAQSFTNDFSVAVNGAAAFFTTATNTVAWPATVRLGQNSVAAGADMYLGEVVMFSRKLTTTERGIVNAYLMSYYGIV